MSYSFQLRAASKAAALAAIASKMTEVTAQQVCHARDKAQAEAAAASFLGLLPEKPGKEIVVTMSGSLSGQWQGSDVVEISGANVMVSVALVDPQPAASLGQPAAST